MFVEVLFFIFRLKLGRNNACMKIVNPLYAPPFKYLMQNDRIAKKVLSALTECEILELAPGQHVMVAVNGKYRPKPYRSPFLLLLLMKMADRKKS